MLAAILGGGREVEGNGGPRTGKRVSASEGNDIQNMKK